MEGWLYLELAQKVRMLVVGAGRRWSAARLGLWPAIWRRVRLGVNNEEVASMGVVGVTLAVYIDLLEDEVDSVSCRWWSILFHSEVQNSSQIQFPLDEELSHLAGLILFLKFVAGPLLFRCVSWISYSYLFFARLTNCCASELALWFSSWFGQHQDFLRASFYFFG